MKKRKYTYSKERLAADKSQRDIDLWAETATLVNQGKSQVEISKYYNITKQAVSQRIKKINKYYPKWILSKYK